MEFHFASDNESDWLRYIKNQGEPLDWLAPYENDLLTILRRGINWEPRFKKSFQLLSSVFSYFALSLSHTEQWSSLLRDALLMAQDIKDNDLQVSVFRWMGEAYLKVGKHESASNMFSIGLERAEQGQTDDMKVAIYTGLFKLQWFDLNHKFTRTLVEQALNTAAAIEDGNLRANLFDALAFAYARLGDTEVALGFSQTAYAYWYAVNSHAGLGRAGYTLAVTYSQIAQHRFDKRFLGKANSFLEIARDELSHTDEKWQYALLSYLQGNIYFQLEDYDESDFWYQQTLSEAEQMNSPQYIAITQHALGLNYTKMGLFPSARRCLHAAQKYWADLNNSYEKVNVILGLADLEMRANHPDLAKSYIDEGLKGLGNIQDEKMYQFMKSQFQVIISQLDSQ